MKGDRHLRVAISQDEYFDTVKIYFYHEYEDSDGIEIMHYNPENGEWTIKKMKRGEKALPTLELPGIRDDMIQKLGDALNKFGYKPPEKMLIEGKYEAQSKHLEDMRKLVFKDNG
jgi:hypothetical protein